MSENNIVLKSVNELLGMKFYIPSYQRGYRWTEQQVRDLLEDIDEFKPETFKDTDGKEKTTFYCLQPLVVKWNQEHNRWEVIDGQQRLTTIYILLACLGEKNPYSIEYETRKEAQFKIDSEEKKGCQEFLKNISNETINGDNIDFFHMLQAKKTIDNWFNLKFENHENKEKLLADFKTKFTNTLLEKVQFIWYESAGEDPIKVFTRLNIGKIGLTNAELIKALFLNQSNFEGKDFDSVRLRQQEIASEWDHIEYTLQNDEFWLFIHDVGYTNPTRIDFIFDLICDQNLLNLDTEQKKKIGTDKYKTFRYFYEYFKKKQSEETIKNCWHEVKTVFQTFNEWYNDLELYHYVGYLVEQGEKIDKLLELWNKAKSKEKFISEKDINKKYSEESIKGKITKKISSCNNLDQSYGESGEKKRDCYPLLLLHNIQTVINQNKNYKDESSYGLAVFYKFPFHLYKLESWDVEHIDSNTENDLTDKESQNEYLLNIYNAVSKDSQEEIKKFIEGTLTTKKFDDLKVPISEENQLSNVEKNQIWNFTLLDSSTNRSYGNSIFSAKRRIIIGKDKGKLIPIPKIVKENGIPKLIIGKEEDAKSSFIPPCTKQIFLKYYSSASSSPNVWDKTDAEAYKNNSRDTLEDFGVVPETATTGGNK